MTYVLDYEGVCPVCEKNTRFRSQHEWFRDYLVCSECENTSVPRDRALAKALNLFCPNWRELKIHESSPSDSGVSLRVRRHCSGYVPTQYFRDVPSGETFGIYRSENLEALTFEDNSFDVFMSLDVLEHIFDPEKAIREIWRTLKPGGYMISTMPIRKYQTGAVERRANLAADGTIEHVKEPEVHGNPIDGTGSLVTVDYGYDLHGQIAEWADFDVCIMRFSDRSAGILGEYTDTVICRKRP
jgi:SAM-dependent methyltransferase